MTIPYDELPKNKANYAPLTPLTFIERAAYVYPNKLSVVNGTERWTWKQTYERCRRLASALARRGVGKNDGGAGGGAQCRLRRVACGVSGRADVRCDGWYFHMADLASTAAMRPRPDRRY